ncbi:retrotransposon protein, putative, ty1-copia subclass [Tanacetum coccineum]
MECLREEATYLYRYGAIMNEILQLCLYPFGICSRVWQHAFSNMVTNKKVDKTPYELWYGKVPNLSYLKEVEEHSLGDLNEPASYKAAMLDSESNKWLDAMNAEIQSMMDNMVWVLVDLPPGCRKGPFGEAAKGYTQLYGVDYEETFSPVADIRAIRILISIAAYYDYEIWQMDVKTAFLNGYLDEDIIWCNLKFSLIRHPRKKLLKYVLGLWAPPPAGNPAQNLGVACIAMWIRGLIEMTLSLRTGYVFVLNGGPSGLEEFQAKYHCNVCYKKSEHSGVRSCHMEAVWIGNSISGLGIVPSINEPLNMYCDNSVQFFTCLMNRWCSEGATTLSKTDIIMIRECVEW